MAVWIKLFAVFATFAAMVFVIPVEQPASLESDSPLIDRFRHVAGEIYCGAEPKGAAAFAELANRGIHTVVSVDSIAPDVANASRHGLRYIHIPIGYDGADDHARRSLTRIARDEGLGRIFIHCHHGRHRGPTAAAITAVAAGSMSNAQAIDFLHTAGTSTEYVGLYDLVCVFAPLSSDVELPELTEQAEVSPLAKMMADIDRLFGAVKENPTRENYLLLHEAFYEWSRQSVTGELDAQFRALMQKAVLASRDDAMLAELEASCVACHEQYRD